MTEKAPHELGFMHISRHVGEKLQEGEELMQEDIKGMFLDHGLRPG